MRYIDLAYIAGLIDGEGYIGIRRITSKANGRANPGFHERIQIRMVDEQAIKFISETLGGHYYREKKHADNGRPLFCYQASDQKAVSILTHIRPFLRVKRRVADRVLEFRRFRKTPQTILVKVPAKNRWGTTTMVNRRRHSPEFIAECERRWQECSDINHGIA